MPSASDKDFYGMEQLTTGTGPVNELMFAIHQQMSKLNTAIPVKVIAIKSGGLNPVGFVDIEPLVQQITGNGKPVDHGVIPNVPYFRLQGGANAVIIDPVVGDIGIAIFSSRDISSVKRTRKKSAPGSRRQHDFSDAMYIGGVLNGAPSQYIQFTGTGIKIVAPTIEITGALTNNGVNVGATHSHSGVEPGGGNTGGPH